MDADEVSIAYHEAGHVVVARALGQQIKRVSLRPTAEYFLDGLVPRPTCVLVALGGPMAQRRLRYYTDEECAALWGTGWSDDLDKVLRLHSYQRDGMIADRMRTARKLVRHNWQSIEKVAAALSERGELTGEQVEYIVREYGSRQWRP